MDETEKTTRVRLKDYRRVATQFQTFICRYRTKLQESPLFEADLIVAGTCEKYAARWIVRVGIIPDDEDAEQDDPDSVMNLTEEGWEEAFRQQHSPFGVVQGVIFPLIIYGLHHYEELFIENCWRLPKWKRPEWLKQMERDRQIESSPGR